MNDRYVIYCCRIGKIVLQFLSLGVESGGSSGCAAVAVGRWCCDKWFVG